MKLQITNPNNIYTVEEKRNRQARPIQYELLDNGCHACVSHDLDKDGYPRFQRNGVHITMSRYIWSLHNQKEIPVGMLVMHTCDNPNCINPDHLKIGTHKDNMLDRSEKGRTPKGSQHWRSGFTEHEVYYIKFIGTESYKELAVKFGKSAEAIKSIKLGKSWKWLTFETYIRSAA